MSEALLSLGLDVGTTSTQLILSRLEVENRAGSFAVPELEISRREILYKSPVHFTPLQSGERIDGPALRALVAEEYRRAGITPEQVDTGAVIITGETSRKENARTVVQELAGFAGDFVVATAGPHLESVLAARGAGAPEYSRQQPGLVLHMDIGGGTSNLAWLRDGQILATGCLNVGGRLIRTDPSGAVVYLSPVLRALTPPALGQRPTGQALEALANTLIQALEMAAGLREPTGLLSLLTTREAGPLPDIGEAVAAISFSGGVADCIGRDHPDAAFGDLGPALGRAIRRSRLCRLPHRLGAETIRATVIGAGCHSTQLSGSTIFHRGITFPLKNLPAARLAEPVTAEALRALDARQEGPWVLALIGEASPGYGRIQALAEAIAAGIRGPILICLEQDMAKALGQALALRTGEPILCLDRVKLSPQSYLDVGAPIGPALPVVVKTLVLGN